MCEIVAFKNLEPFDQVIVERRFKIQSIEYRVTCFFILPAILCIPPSVKSGRQILSQAVNLTSRKANMQNYVEQAIKRRKKFRIIENKLPILLISVFDDIITVCAIKIYVKMCWIRYLANHNFSPLGISRI